jgi:hypothetical protein
LPRFLHLSAAKGGVMKKVSADTITDMTIRSGPSAGPPSPTPSVQQLIAEIRSTLLLREKALAQLAEQSREGAAPGDPPTAYEISHRRAAEGIKEFEKILANVPDGFRLVPVLYTTVDQKQNEKIKREFSARVRPHFLHFLAEEYADELKALGIGPRGVEMMRKGLYPVDAAGNLYAMNIDHIIECFGGGKMSLQKETDPLMPAGSNPTFLVNHFSNFILLPIQVHEFKNLLNGLQNLAQTKTGESRWALMLIPETGPGRSAYIAPPQKPGHPLHGLRTHSENPEHQIKHASYMVDQVHDALRSDITGAASQEIFLRPAIEDLAGRLEIAFNSAAGSSNGYYKAFLRFYSGEKMATLRKETENLPYPEASRLHKAMGNIDASIRARFNRRANDNARIGRKTGKARRKDRNQRHRHPE